ncbi:MAG: hypothetical protein USCAAHI_00669 [Beijerinckiaceae bacterium]|nr:MAG: hypothetical protein USCAAHI_00669 [Beijerinckiaceae bacterium]
MSNPAAVSLGRIGAMVLMANGFWPASALPMPLPAIPSVEQIGESIITQARKLMNRREAKHPAEPDVARGTKPNGDRAISAYVQAAVASEI